MKYFGIDKNTIITTTVVTFNIFGNADGSENHITTSTVKNSINGININRVTKIKLNKIRQMYFIDLMESMIASFDVLPEQVIRQIMMICGEY